MTITLNIFDQTIKNPDNYVLHAIETKDDIVVSSQKKTFWVWLGRIFRLKRYSLPNIQKLLSSINTDTYRRSFINTKIEKYNLRRNDQIKHIEFITGRATITPAMSKNEVPKQFQMVQKHIKDKYPDFPIDRYSSIQEMEIDGHPCHYAIENEDNTLLRLLIIAGADTAKTNENINTPIDLVWDSMHPISLDIVKLLTISKAKLNKPTAYEKLPIHSFSDIFYDTDILKKTIPSIQDIAVTDEQGNTLLHLLVENDNITEEQFVELATVLIAKDLPVDTQDIVGRSPLYKAISRQKKTIVTFLLSNGASALWERERAPNMGAKSPLELAKTMLEQNITRRNALKITREENAYTLCKDILEAIESKLL